MALVKIEVAVDGVQGPLYENVMARLLLNLQKNNGRLQANAIRRLHKQAQNDIRSALAPFGYYNPVIHSRLKNQNGTWLATYTIEKGPPVRVKKISLKVTGAGVNNKGLITALSRFPLKEGAILNQDEYEQGKKTLINTAFNEGLLDATFSQHTLLINPKTNSASVKLALETGKQYVFGKTSSTQQMLKQEIINRFIPYKIGEPYNPAKLFELQAILYKTNYFSRVVVRGHIDKAKNLLIPVELELTIPERLNKYNLGLGYATNTGIRGKIDWFNRLFNDKGHQVNASFQLAQRENTISLNYNLPQGNPRYNKLIYSLAYQDKNWDVTSTRLLTAAVSREHSSPRFKFSAGLEFRDELYDVGNTSGRSTLMVPSLNWGVVLADDILNTQNGLQASIEMLGALKETGSDATFLKTSISGKAIISPLDKWRLIGRGSLGGTLVDTINSLPPSLRFYTGGDMSIRGYSYRSIGTKDSAGAVIGGRYLVVGSIEVERIIRNQWSIAAFWDGGSATDDLKLDFYQGIGLGVRFRLPFGQIRFDLASAVSEDGHPLRVHFSIGGDL